MPVDVNPTSRRGPSQFGSSFLPCCLSFCISRTKIRSPAFGGVQIAFALACLPFSPGSNPPQTLPSIHHDRHRSSVSPQWHVPPLHSYISFLPLHKSPPAHQPQWLFHTILWLELQLQQLACHESRGCTRRRGICWHLAVSTTLNKYACCAFIIIACSSMVRVADLSSLLIRSLEILSRVIGLWLEISALFSFFFCNQGVKIICDSLYEGLVGYLRHTLSPFSVYCNVLLSLSIEGSSAADTLKPVLSIVPDATSIPAM